MPSKENDPAKENRPVDRADCVMRRTDPAYRRIGFMVDVVKACKTIAGFFRRGKK